MKILLFCVWLFSALALVWPTKDGNNNEEICEADKAVGINFTELRAALRAKEVVLVDVRSYEEVEQDGLILNSHNIPLNQVEEAFRLPKADFQIRYQFKKPDPLQEDLVINCQGGVRALHAWRLLNPLGFCNARVYYGSFEDWKENGGEIVYKRSGTR